MTRLALLQPGISTVITLLLESSSVNLEEIASTDCESECNFKRKSVNIEPPSKYQYKIRQIKTR